MHRVGKFSIGGVLVNCRFEHLGRSEIRGDFHKWKCLRCGRIGHVLYDTADKVIGPDCQGWPLPSESSLWIDGFFRAAGVSQAVAICQYIRWRFRGSKLDELPPGIPRPDLRPPEQGPGTELHKLISGLGIMPDASCGCEAMRSQMNQWGPGCNDHREEILAHLREAYASTDWPTKLRSAAGALAQGLPLTIEGLLDEALHRAESLATKQPQRGLDH